LTWRRLSSPAKCLDCVARGLTLTGVVKTRCHFAKLIAERRGFNDVPPLLKKAEIRSRLEHLQGWKQDGDFITKTFEFKRFMDGVSFINSVAKVAEEQEHHPDIHVRYTTINLSIQTHSEGGITEWDFELAGAIERMALKRRARKKGI
jgi:4a-hydroxytetrahydrobiopterin dehydratase